uniref:Tc1-like transposase DDE domain-containing protein n=1 Tax=Oncorhynchus tshawytscha TaxID=74940 RepID=A0AAZ3NWE4_ONCTS
MQQVAQVLRDRAIGMLTARMSTRDVTRELNVNFSTISHLQCCFRKFGCTSSRPHNRRPCVWRRVDEKFADVNVVNRVPHGGVGVIVWAGISYGQGTQLHFIDGNLNAERYRDEILRPIVVPFIPCHPLMFQNNALLHVARICIRFLEAENVPVLPWPAYSPDVMH